MKVACQGDGSRALTKDSCLTSNLTQENQAVATGVYDVGGGGVRDAWEGLTVALRTESLGLET